MSYPLPTEERLSLKKHFCGFVSQGDLLTYTVRIETDLTVREFSWREDMCFSEDQVLSSLMEYLVERAECVLSGRYVPDSDTDKLQELYGNLQNFLDWRATHPAIVSES